MKPDAPTDTIDPLTSALIAATVHAKFRGRARIVNATEVSSPVVQAILAATVDHMFHEHRVRIVSIETSPYQPWAAEGRRDIFYSHRVR